MQTQYTIGMAVGFAGMIADAAIVQDIETFYNPAGPVYFGRVVSRSGAGGLIAHPAAATDVTDERLVRGVVVATHELVSNSNASDPNYAASQPIPVMRKGRIWVLAEDVVTEGTSTVNVRYAGAGSAGALRGAAAGETAVLPKSKWKSSTSGAGQLAVLELDL